MRKSKFFSVMILILVFSIACSEESAKKDDSQDSPEKTKETMTVEEAVDTGHVVVVTKKDKSHKDFTTQETVKVYHLKKVFRFDQKIDEGESARLKITTIPEGIPPRTVKLAFDGKVIHYSSGDKNYKCKTFSTYNVSSFSDMANVQLFKCTNDGEEIPEVFILQDAMEHFQQVKEAFKEKLGGTK